MISTLRTHTTKGGKAMAFATLEDLTGKVDLVFFPKPWQGCRESVRVDQILVVRGTVQADNDSLSVLVHSAQTSLTVHKSAELPATGVPPIPDEAWFAIGEETPPPPAEYDLAPGHRNGHNGHQVRPATPPVSLAMLEPAAEYLPDWMYFDDVGEASPAWGGDDDTAGSLTTAVGNDGDQPPGNTEITQAYSTGQYTNDEYADNQDRTTTVTVEETLIETVEMITLTSPQPMTMAGSADETAAVTTAYTVLEVPANHYAPVTTGFREPAAATYYGRTLVVEIKPVGNWKEACRQSLKLASRYEGDTYLRLQLAGQGMTMDFPNHRTACSAELITALERLPGVIRAYERQP
jgi:DNA polymerase-3 subunit alpha